MPSRRAEFRGPVVEKDVHLAGLCAFASRKLTRMHILYVGSGLSLVIDGMVCHVGIAMRDRLRCLRHA